MKATLSEKGQVTIPKKIRQRLGLMPGTVIDFEAQDGKLVGVKADTVEDPVAAVTGIVRAHMSVDDYLEETRGPSR
ncbi:MAG: AbrB/MazE/SpoVT family DNA-binding domain-containing protein [Bradymonadales bacterium]|nr:AbrB/MazE/SpoVT family DNA-binding domain-containing protein [Bradymonadales bacterium]